MTDVSFCDSTLMLCFVFFTSFGFELDRYFIEVCRYFIGLVIDVLLCDFVEARLLSIHYCLDNEMVSLVRRLSTAPRASFFMTVRRF